MSEIYPQKGLPNDDVGEHFASAKVASATGRIIRKHYAATIPYCSEYMPIQVLTDNQKSGLEAVTIGAKMKQEAFLGGAALSAHVEFFWESAGLNQDQDNGSVDYSVNTDQDMGEVAFRFSDSHAAVGWIAFVDAQSLESDHPLAVDMIALLAEHFELGSAKNTGNRWSIEDVDHRDERKALELVRRAGVFLDILRFDLLAKYLNDSQRIQ